MSSLRKRFLLQLYDFYTWAINIWKVQIRKLDKLILAKSEGLAHAPQEKRRAAVIAIYPSASSLPFTINLLKALVRHKFFIILVSDRPVAEHLRRDLLLNCHQLIERAGVGADFASYKAGWIALTQNNVQLFSNLETLLIANDSLFYPQNIDATLGAMLEKDEDWQCLFQGFEFAPHAQSYFLLFRRPVFTSKCFRVFWDRYLGKSSRRHRIIHGEIALSSKLARGGFHSHSHYSSSFHRF